MVALLVRPISSIFFAFALLIGGITSPLLGQEQNEYRLSVAGGGPVGYFVRSSDRSAVCGSTVDVTVRAEDKKAFEPAVLGIRQLQQAQGYIQQIFCKRSFDRTVIKFTMIAGGQIARRVSLDSADGIPREEFSDPSQLRNPSGEKLDTSNLRTQTFLNHIFYGRFDKMRAEDIGRGQFAWLYYEFISQYGLKHRRYLKPPLKEYTVTVDITRAGVTTRSSSTYVMEERIYPSFNRNEGYRSGIFGSHHADIDVLLQRHAATGPAMKQLYENFYRYANDRPPVQDTPGEAAALFEASPTPSVPSPPSVERSPVSKAVERFLQSRLPFAIPAGSLTETSDFVAARFQTLPLQGEDRNGWISGAGEQQQFNFGIVSSFVYGRTVARATKDAVRRFRDDIVAHDPLLFSAACVFCDQPVKENRPAGFAARFLSARPRGAGALSDETLLDPARFVDMNRADANLRDKWRKEMSGNAGGQILRCEYLPEDGSMASRKLRTYWYHAAPMNWSQASAQLSPNHPLLGDVGPPRNSCPDRPE